MIVDVIMPKMGESINEGTILEWRKKVGDVIQLDEILLEIGTDKVDSEIPSSAAGIILEILAEPNDIKEVGEVIARIDTNTDTAGESTLSNNVEKEVIAEATEPSIPKIIPTKEDVNKAYIKIQKKIHPDISPETSRLSSIVNEAKDIVLNHIS